MTISAPAPKWTTHFHMARRSGFDSPKKKKNLKIMKNKKYTKKTQVEKR